MTHIYPYLQITVFDINGNENVDQAILSALVKCNMSGIAESGGKSTGHQNLNGKLSSVLVI